MARIPRKLLVVALLVAWSGVAHASPPAASSLERWLLGEGPPTRSARWFGHLFTPSYHGHDVPVPLLADRRSPILAEVARTIQAEGLTGWFTPIGDRATAAGLLAYHEDARGLAPVARRHGLTPWLMDILPHDLVDNTSVFYRTMGHLRGAMPAGTRARFDLRLANAMLYRMLPAHFAQQGLPLAIVTNLQPPGARTTVMASLETSSALVGGASAHVLYVDNQALRDGLPHGTTERWIDVQQRVRAALETNRASLRMQAPAAFRGTSPGAQGLYLSSGGYSRTGLLRETLWQRRALRLGR